MYQLASFWSSSCPNHFRRSSPRWCCGLAISTSSTQQRGRSKSPNTEPTRESNAPVGKAQPNLLAELITLAHESGHMFSWKGRTPPERWARYHEVEKRRDEIARAFNHEADAAQLVEPERTRQLGARMFEKLNNDERGLIIEEEELASAIGRELLESLGCLLGEPLGADVLQGIRRPGTRKCA